MNTGIKKAVKNSLAPIVILITAYFFAKSLKNNWHNLEGISIRPNFTVAVGVIFLIASVVLSGIIWGWLLETLSERKVLVSDAIRIHSASWLLKYVPGQIGSALNKVSWGTKQGFSKKIIANSFIYENVLMVIAGFIVAMPVFVLFFDEINSDYGILLPLLVILPMFVVIYQPLFYGIVNFIFTRLKRQPFQKSDFLSSKSLFKYLALYLTPRIVNGIGFVFIAASIVSISPGDYVGFCSAYVLAGIIGLLAFFVPSGLGVREAVLVLLLGSYLGTEQAIVLSLMARFYATIADLGILAVYLILNKGKVAQR